MGCGGQSWRRRAAEALWSPEDHGESQMLDNELQDLIYVVRCWFCFYLIVSSLIIPLWNKKVRNLFFILQEPTVNNHS